MVDIVSEHSISRHYILPVQIKKYLTIICSVEKTTKASSRWAINIGCEDLNNLADF
jgi:hypothetical protein